MLEFRLRFVTTDQPVLKTAYYEVNDYERRYPSELPADHDPLRLRRRVRDRSTKQNISIEICSKCHPFYTGKQKLVDTSGRVDKFNKKYGIK